MLAVRGLGLIGPQRFLAARLPAARTGRQGHAYPGRLLDPDSDALARRAAKIGESAESLASGVRLAEARLRELAEAGDVGVWRYQMLPTWRVIRTDCQRKL
ncbi:hypothetical protein [Streptomyces chartreusis]|uniref:hypothetical protein n=1 Tax=Streptomyces chartreusis TaxID=1969 RepID=UPI003828D170